MIQIVSLVNIFQLQPYKATPEEAMSTDSEIQDQARRAIDMFLASVTYPVIWSNGDRIATLDSGVTVRVTVVVKTGRNSPSRTASGSHLPVFGASRTGRLLGIRSSHSFLSNTSA